MGRMKRPGNSGSAKAFITRRKAVAKLQVSLRDFRRLCILKGIYPVDPRNKSKLGSGGVGKTYYLLSDIQYLSHEPVMWKLWDMKIFMRKLKRATGRRDYDILDRIRENRPFYKVDHIVKERYPTFVDSIRDLDDAVSMLCLYSRFPRLSSIPQEIINYSRKLTVEFMHYIIEAKALRKVFVSIKGYYYQAEIMGQAVTWVVPHDFVLSRVPDVDYKVLMTFTEFYITLMGFVNYKLFSSINLCYPPKSAVGITKEQAKLMAGEDEADIENEYISALSRPLLKSKVDQSDPDVKVDEFEDVEKEDGEEEVKSCVGLTFEQTAKLQKLFEGLKFFIGREVPREALVFIIRSFGGLISWDKIMFIGATYDETDETITHHIVDREVIPNKYMNRHYIQPQWIFDCVNARTLIPVQDYFPGEILPPHLSPFVQEIEGEYVSPEVVRLRQLQSGINPSTRAQDITDDENDEEVEKEEKIDDYKRRPGKRAREEEKASEAKRSKEEDKVLPGKIVKVDKGRKERMDKAEEKRMAEMMIPKKKKHLYDKIMFGKKRQVRETQQLKDKRAEYERNNKNKNKKAR
ncbi:Pescadillo -like protein [Halotydeus destructor]|nr:Pescadillo -like protein [Halotydeus destructor]